MRVVFFLPPYYGHITPNLPLLSELVKRGCRVLLFGPMGRQNRVIREQIISSAMQVEELPARVAAFYTANHKIIRDYYAGYYRESRIRDNLMQQYSISMNFYEQCRDRILAFQPDVMLYDSFSGYAGSVIKRIALPAGEINCAVYEPEDMTASASGTAFIREILQPSDPAAPEIGQIHFARKKAWQWYEQRIGSREPDARYCYLIPEFTESGMTCVFAGFRGDHEEKKRAEKDVIYISSGTVTESLTDVISLRNILRGLRGQGKAVLSVGGQKYLEESVREALPENVELFLFADQRKMLDRAQIFITHGGITGMRESVFCCTPMLVIPADYQGYLVGRAIEREHAGRMLAHFPVQPEEVSACVQDMRNHFDMYDEGIRALRNKWEKQWERVGAAGIADDLLSLSARHSRMEQEKAN